mmetsp:Transcript_7239/g.12190  ORF Transcript_7239/g.12190 Transcript_7239/m.12190 type:complete len:280 (+) Transcript_7239:151-990(+)
MAEEEGRLLDDRAAPQGLLHGKSCDAQHRRTAVLDLGQLHLARREVLGELLQRVEAIVACLRLAVADHLLSDAGARALGEHLDVGQAGEDDRDREEVLEELAVEEGWCAPAGRADRVQELRDGPAGRCDHGEASVLQLRLAHPRKSHRPLFRRHALEPSLPVPRADEPLELVGLLIREGHKPPRVEAVVALVCLSVEVDRDGVEKLRDKLVFEQLQLVGKAINSQTLGVPDVGRPGARETSGRLSRCGLHCGDGLGLCDRRGHRNGHGQAHRREHRRAD